MNPILVADLFCGAGGSSTGARRALAALGLRMNLVAVNHWSVAVDTHTRNHPEARHLCVDVYRTTPREAIPGGRLDLLMASPTCTYFSRARGGKPISRDQRFGRMTPTQVLRWLTDLDVRALLVENVPEFVGWGPVSRETGKPIKAKAGVYFRAWVRRIERLGYRVSWRVLNAADFGDATTRQRFFLMARKDGRAPAWPEATHSKAGGAADLFSLPTQRWRAAREVIDWSLRGRSIFGRKKPLSPKTLARIYAGAVKFGWPEPFLVVLRQHMGARSVDEPIPALTAAGTHVGLVQGVPFVFGNRTNNVGKNPEVDPLPGLTTATGGGVALVLPQGGGGAARPVEEPMATIATDGALALIAPYYGQSGCAPVSDPLGTITTRDRFGLVAPVTHGGDRSARARSVEEPLPTITGANRGELAFIAAAFGERVGQAPRVHDVDAPAPSICATGRVQLVEGQAEPRVDVLFRMLQPHELAAAMGFSDDETAYEFAGTKGDIIRQIGNAVPVRTSAALVGAIFARKAKAVVA